MERLSVGLELKFADDSAPEGTFSGYGAVFGNRDSYDDIIQKGAFKDTLKAWKKMGRLPPMLLQHGGFFGPADDMVPVGVWTSMQEDDTGLKVEGRLFAIDTDRGRYIHEGLKAKALDGLSIGYVTKEAAFGTKPDEPRRILKKIDLMEVSIVTFPANPDARVSQAKGQRFDARELEAALREAGLSRSDAVKAVAILRKSLQRDAGAPAPDPRDEVPAAELRSLKERFRALRPAI
jgi:uncharacterized protein